MKTNSENIFGRGISLILILVATCLFAAEPTVKTGDLVFQYDFESPDALDVWNKGKNPSITIDAGFNSAHALKVVSPDKNGSSNVVARYRLDLKKYKDCTLLCSAMIKAQDVSKPPNPWNGVKFMLVIDTPSGKKYLHRNAPMGSFDWEAYKFLAQIPQDIQDAELVLGLELTSGVAWFDNIKIQIRRTPVQVVDYKAPATMYKGHDLPRLRGAMIGPLNEQDFIEFGNEWKANHVRWQLTWNGFPHSPADNGDLAAYDKWLSGELDRIDRMLPVCEKAGLMIVIDLHTPPGGRNKSAECNIFYEKRFQDNFIKWWEHIARRYKGKKIVWGYDLMNEPLCGAELGDGCLDWNELALETAKRIRAIDPDHAIIIEPEPWADPASIKNLPPFPIPGVVYSVHMYKPHKFTHQGVYDNNSGIEYPGVIDGIYWDKAQLKKELQPVLEFQKKYNVHIYIGEFSAIRWAPGKSAYNYLSDLIDIFEEYGWDWAYHAFREWDGWSVEHGPDKKVRTKSPVPTDRELLLKSWYSKNRKPVF
jgi:hypothetical protein